MPLAVILLLVAALVPGVDPSRHVVEVLVGACLVVLLFEGGLGLGPRRARSLLVPTTLLGLLGTLVTAAALIPLAHLVLDTSWYDAALVGAALAPTDPAVVFSVLRGRDLGRVRTLLEAESGANDPVGIALVAALLAAGSLSSGAVVDASRTFALQLVVGLAVGVAGARVLRLLPPWPALLATGGVFGLAHVLHGSGYLAVFVAGVLLGDRFPSYRRVPGVAEAVAFVVLGTALDLDADQVLPGLALAVGLVVARLLCWPLVVGLTARERLVVLTSGLKGAVPLLLGTMLPGRLPGVVAVAVVASVVVQGTLLRRTGNPQDP